MPWDANGMTRHNGKLHGARAGHAARIANAVLKRSGDEGMALAVANGWAKKHKRALGGGTPMKDAQSSYAPGRNWSERLPTRDPGDYGMERRPPAIHSPILLQDPYPNDARSGLASGGPVPQAQALAVANGWAKKRHADGGYVLPRKSPERERAAEILSQGRGQSRQTDLNVTPFSAPGANGGPLDTREAPSWLPQFMGPDTTRITPPSNWGNRLASGGAPQAPTYQTAAPAVNAQGFVPVPQGGTYNLDLTTGAMQPGSNAALQGVAQRGLPIKDPNAPPPPQPGLDPWAQALFFTPRPVETFNGSSEGGGGSDEGGGAARGGRRAAGGPAAMSMSQATPWWTRSEARGEEAHPAGLVPGMGGGRQDNVAMSLAPHSHVIPAMVVAGMGQGNPSQGALNIEHAMNSGPFGTAVPKVPTRTPRALPMGRMPRMAKGGGVEHGGVRTLVSPAEYIVPPSDVLRLGKGDYDKGHDFLDRCIVEWRRQIVANERKQPPPVKE